MAPEPEVPQVTLRRGPGRPRKSESASSSASPAMAPKKLPAQKDAPKVTKDGGIRKTSGTKSTGTGPNIKHVKPPLSKVDPLKGGLSTKPPAKQGERAGPNIKYVKKPLSQEDPVNKGPSRPPKSGIPDLFAKSTKAFSQPPVLNNVNEVGKTPARSTSSRPDASNTKIPDAKKSAQASSQARVKGGQFAFEPSRQSSPKKNHARPGPLAPGFGSKSDKLSTSMSQLPTPPAIGVPAQQNQPFASTMAQKMSQRPQTPQLQNNPQSAWQSQKSQLPRTPPPFRERRDIKEKLTVFSPPVVGALQARPEFGYITVGDTGVPVEEVHAFLRRFLRLVTILPSLPFAHRLCAPTDWIVYSRPQPTTVN
ncbi:hypothetical protein BDZ45DRAFT_348758 [Acephala macrosclerotiorum]|nr:hypothetical protein BDZ45DRAFT_348758 [Acephala macrosclerotiorum]